MPVYISNRNVQVGKVQIYMPSWTSLSLQCFQHKGMSITLKSSIIVTPILIFTIDEYNYIPRKRILALAAFIWLFDQTVANNHFRIKSQDQHCILTNTLSSTRTPAQDNQEEEVICILSVLSEEPMCVRKITDSQHPECYSEPKIWPLYHRPHCLCSRGMV